MKLFFLASATQALKPSVSIQKSDGSFELLSGYAVLGDTIKIDFAPYNIEDCYAFGLDNSKTFDLVRDQCALQTSAVIDFTGKF